jgi:lipid A 4'-phosphatase
MAVGLRFMRYLKTPRARILLLSFSIFSLLSVKFPGIDLFISGQFFDHGFYLAHQRWTELLHESVTVSIVLILSTVAGICVFNTLFRHDVCGINGTKVLYVFLVLAVGAGLIVNATLKDNFGRVRPRDVQEFGGSRHFTPAFVIADGCKRNCSFSSGDSAGAFLSLAVVLSLSRRRAIAAAALGFGVAVSFSRIAIGAHYLSDTVVSFFVMLIVADVLHHCMCVAPHVPVKGIPERRPNPAIQPSSALGDP